ncbi:MAG TPA: LON peptidase substrate-binding domain-containing protein, partial [Ferruginibacter sp.]|nr:LON peptidase substrate-binding domain-containing protein [Ferruginibacter sp.]
MDKQFYLQGPEDEMEFLPIIPLNEEDDGSADEQAIPEEIPLLALRNTVLFPGVVIPITVGRDKSIKAVQDAYKADKLIGVVAQKDSNVEEPTVSDLEDIGTVARIAKLIKMPDGGTTIIIQGRKRCKIEEVTTDDPYFRAKIKILTDE